MVATEEPCNQLDLSRWDIEVSLGSKHTYNCAEYNSYFYTFTPGNFLCSNDTD